MAALPWQEYAIGALGGLYSHGMTMFGYDQQAKARAEDRDFQREMWQRTNEYNSPANQARLMQQGGFSPSAMFQGSTPGAASMPTVGSHNVNPQLSELQSNPMRGFSTIAQALQSLSQVDKNVAELPKVQAEIDKLFADAKLSDAKADYQELYNTFYNAYGKRMMENEVNEGVSRFVLNMANARLAAEQGDTQESIRLLNLAKRDEAKALSGLHGAQRENVEMDTKFQIASLEYRINNIKSSTAKNNAEARSANATAEQQEFITSLQKRPDVKHQLVEQLIQGAQNAKKQGKIMDQQVNVLEWQCKQLEKATDNYEIQMWSNIINQTINTAANAVGEFTKFGLAKKFLDTKPSMIESGRGYMMNDQGILMKNPY